MIAAHQLAVPFGLAPGLDLAIEAGERVAILGPNGAGKTTLIRALAGLQPLRGGEVRLDGRPLTAWSARERARRLAWVPQDTDAAPDFTVGEVVALGRLPWRRGWRGPTPADAAAIARALEHAGLTALADRPLARLSGGERQRVVFARALAQTPAVLLLDEPTAHLDLAHRAGLLARLAGTDASLTVVAVLHDVNLAALYFPRLVLIAGGRVLADGAPADVLTPALLEAAYGVPVRVLPHPETGTPQVLAPAP
ncbi:MAG: ABC transporter ATP-binding protein [Myxococcales bacterium]|nr:ABC transporter ATP-binding protein [Myxococcales bacterium]